MQILNLPISSTFNLGAIKTIWFDTLDNIIFKRIWPPLGDFFTISTISQTCSWMLKDEVYKQDLIENFIFLYVIMQR